MSNLTIWSPQVELRDRASRVGPALANSNGILCMAWRGLNEDNIWVSISWDNGITWSPQRILRDRATRNAPALTSICNRFVMAWQGLFEDTIWVSTSTDGLEWTRQRPLTDRGTAENPALGSTGDLGVMVWRGVGGDVNLWVSTSTDGVHWTPQQPLRDRATRNGPAVAGAIRGPRGERRFSMTWRGLLEDTLWISTSDDGVHWSPQQPLTDRGTKSAPGMTHSEQLDVFYMAWQGVGEDNNIWVSFSEDGTTWSPQEKLEDRATRSGPVGLAPANMMYMAWLGLLEPNIWGSRLE